MIINEVLGIVKSVLGKVITDKDKQLEIESKINELAYKGEFAEEENRVSLLMAEVKSTDKFVSRARPGFIYVFLGLLVLSLPVGILNTVNPNLAQLFCSGMRLWLDSIPEVLWNVFIAGYLGYGAFRSLDKMKSTPKL